jgi:hypothetical protein
MSDFEECISRAIAGATEQVVEETVRHEKRMEFWQGYLAAYREIRSHPEWWAAESNE